MSKLKVVTYNVRGLNDMDKCGHIFNLLHTKNLNMIFLQEIHSTKKIIKQWRSEWGGRAIFSHADSASWEVCILIARNLDIKSTDR